MKNIIVALCAGFLLSTSVDAQTKTKIKVKSNTSARVTAPDAVKSAFETKYTGTTGTKWTKAYNGNYVVSFTGSDNLKQTAEYDKDGNLVRTKTIYGSDNIPANISTAFSSAYADGTITDVTKLELNGVAPYYKVKFKQGENTKEILMSEEGTISE